MKVRLAVASSVLFSVVEVLGSRGGLNAGKEGIDGGGDLGDAIVDGKGNLELGLESTETGGV